MDKIVSAVKMDRRILVKDIIPYFDSNDKPCATVIAADEDGFVGILTLDLSFHYGDCGAFKAYWDKEWIKLSSLPVIRIG